MTLIKEWFALKKDRAFTKHHKRLFITILAIFVLLIVLFDLPDRNYRIYDAAISPETGTVVASAQHGKRALLYVFSSDSSETHIYTFADGLGKSILNRVFWDDGRFVLYSESDAALYNLDEIGNVTEVRKLSSDECDKYRDLDRWNGWEIDGNVYSCTQNGYSCRYDDSDYLTLKLKKGQRKLSLEDADGDEFILWQSSERVNYENLEKLKIDQYGD